MTDTLTQRARDVAGRLNAPDWHDPACPFVAICHCGADGELPPHDRQRDADKVEAAAIISELVERIEGAWQDIETAPKDGEWFLAAKGKIPFVTAWDEDEEAFFSFNQHYESDQRRYKQPHEWKPTHWMPLPPPPSVLGKQEGEG